MQIKIIVRKRKHRLEKKALSPLFIYLYSAFNNTDCVKALNSIKLEECQ